MGLRPPSLDPGSGNRSSRTVSVTCARARLHFEAPADVAQLVEHFTRNEGVRGSNPRVGSPFCVAAFALGPRAGGGGPAGPSKPRACATGW